MSTDTVDMSILISGEPKRVILGKDRREFLFPADVPIETAVRIEDLTQRAQTAMQTAVAGEVPEDQTLIEELLALIVELAQMEDPTVETLPLTLTQLILFFPTNYGGLDLEAFVASSQPERPTKARKARAAGTTKTASTSRPKTGKKAPARRSSRS